MWPQLPQPADLGRVRGLDLRHGVAAVLVRRPDPRPGDAARPRRRAASAAVDLRHARAWAGAARRGTGTATRRPTCCWPASRRRWCVSVHTVVSFDFAVAHRARLARDDLPALLRRRRHLLRLRDGADAGDPAPRVLRPRGLHHRCATSTTWRKVMLATGLIVAYGYMMETFIAWYSGNTYERFMIVEPHRSGPYALGLLGADRSATSLAPQPLWFQRVRAQHRRRCSSSRMFVNVGMWLERFVIIVDQPAPRLPAVVVGHVLRRRSGTGRRSSARSACSSRCCSCSSASCR